MGVWMSNGHTPSLKINYHPLPVITANKHVTSKAPLLYFHIFSKITSSWTTHKFVCNSPAETNSNSRLHRTY